jgi:hypothetical protein
MSNHRRVRVATLATIAGSLVLASPALANDQTNGEVTCDLVANQPTLHMSADLVHFSDSNKPVYTDETINGTSRHPAQNPFTFSGSSFHWTDSAPGREGSNTVKVVQHWRGSHGEFSATVTCPKRTPPPKPEPTPPPPPTQQQQQQQQQQQTTVVVNQTVVVVAPAAPAKPVHRRLRGSFWLMVHTHHGHLVRVRVWLGGKLVVNCRHLRRNDIERKLSLRGMRRVVRLTVTITTSTGKRIVVVEQVRRTGRGIVIVDP